MSNDIYERLREFLDTLPTGFPATPTGVEIRILKKLFTPEEAELTMNLQSEPEEALPDSSSSWKRRIRAGRKTRGYGAEGTYFQSQR